MKFSTTLLAATTASLALAAPTPTIEKRAQMCGQWDSATTGTYTVYQDLWGESAATSGSQCTTITSLSSTLLKWTTTWSWTGGSSSVKSYANAVVALTPTPLSQLTSLATTWSWSYTGTSVVADVSYDMFSGATATGAHEYEVMVWLAALGGAGPISATGKAIASTTIAGRSWEVWYGLNGDCKVYSFVPATGEYTGFTGDLMDFWKYLESEEGVSNAQVLQSVGAGTEPFTGVDAVFTTSGYSLVVK